MSFYTYVGVRGSKILYRGYNDEAVPITTKYDFKPELFVASTGNPDALTLEGKGVDRVEFSGPSDMREFIKQYESVGGFEYYGMEKPVNQFVAWKFPNDIKFDPTWIDIGNIDIEVHSSTPKYSPKHKIKVRKK